MRIHNRQGGLQGVSRSPPVTYSFKRGQHHRSVCKGYPAECKIFTFERTEAESSARKQAPETDCASSPCRTKDQMQDQVAAFQGESGTANNVKYRESRTGLSLLPQFKRLLEGPQRTDTHTLRRKFQTSDSVYGDVVGSGDMISR